MSDWVDNTFRGSFWRFHPQSFYINQICGWQTDRDYESNGKRSDHRNCQRKRKGRFPENYRWRYQEHPCSEINNTNEHNHILRIARKPLSANLDWLTDLKPADSFGFQRIYIESRCIEGKIDILRFQKFSVDVIFWRVPFERPGYSCAELNLNIFAPRASSN